LTNIVYEKDGSIPVSGTIPSTVYRHMDDICWPNQTAETTVELLHLFHNQIHVRERRNKATIVTLGRLMRRYLDYKGFFLPLKPSQKISKAKAGGNRKRGKPSSKKQAARQGLKEHTTEKKKGILQRQQKVEAQRAELADCAPEYTLYFDGASRGNPGLSGAGAALFNPAGKEIWIGQVFVGETATNNQAEYKACIMGLTAAKALGIQKIRVIGDSQLVVKQAKGEYQVLSPLLRPLYEDLKAIVQSFEAVEFYHVLRELNERADKLSNEAIDARLNI
jgi:ribonuclease HI